MLIDLLRRQSLSVILFSCLMVCVLYIGCGSSNDSNNSNTQETTTNKNTIIPESIIGDVNWEDVISLPENDDKRQLSKYVGYFYIRVDETHFSRCTASLISPSLIITNYHCIRDHNEFYVNFNYYSALDYNSSSDLRNDSWNCSDVVFENGDDDFAILKCNPLDNEGKIPYDDLKGYISLDIDNPILPNIDNEVYLIHQNCNYTDYSNCSWDGTYPPGEATKKISYGEIIDYPITNYTFKGYDYTFSGRYGFKHTADTLGGTSGALVFLADNHEVIGIHHGGDSSVDPEYNLARTLISILENNQNVSEYIEKDINKISICDLAGDIVNAIPYNSKLTIQLDLYSETGLREFQINLDENRIYNKIYPQFFPQNDNLSIEVDISKYSTGNHMLYLYLTDIYGCSNYSYVDSYSIDIVSSHYEFKCYDNNVYWFDSSGVRNDLKESCQFGCSVDTCNPNPKFEYKCYNNDVYWYNANGVRTELKENCQFGCKDNACDTNSKYVVKCYNDDVYWYDIDGNRTELKESCQYGCTGNTCDPNPQYEYKCYGNDVYWYDSNGNRTDKKESCQYGCTGNTCDPNPQYEYKCYGNDVYWYDSNGNRADKKESCQYGCTGNTCDPNPQYEYKCYNGDLYWYDSDGNRTDRKESCQYGCTGNTCDPNPQYEYKCYNGDVYWYDSNGKRTDRKEYCQYGCTGNTCDPNPQYEYKCYNGDVYWYDSNGKRTDRKEYCQQFGCTVDACNPDPEYEYKCYDGDVYWYDSNGNRAERKEYCQYKCDNNKCVDCLTNEEETESCYLAGSGFTLRCPPGMKTRKCINNYWEEWSSCKVVSGPKYYGDGSLHCGDVICLTISPAGSDSQLKATLSKKDNTVFTNDVDLTIYRSTTNFISYGCVPTSNKKLYEFNINPIKFRDFDIETTISVYAKIISPCNNDVFFTFETGEAYISRCR